MAASAPVPEQVLDRVVGAFLTAVRLPAVARRRHVLSVFPVGPASEQRMTSWFVAVDGAYPDWDAETADAVSGLVAIAALDRARRGEGLRVARDIADDAIELIAEGGGDRPETAVRLRQGGLDPGRRRWWWPSRRSSTGRTCWRPPDRCWSTPPRT